MQKIKLQGIALFLTLVFAIPIGFAVLNNEKIKKDAKASSTQENYRALGNDFKAYKKTYEDAVTQARKANAAAIAKTKADYEKLLADQSTAIAQHTTTSTTTQTITTPGKTVTVPSSSTSVSVSKPSSKKTKTS